MTPNRLKLHRAAQPRLNRMRRLRKLGLSQKDIGRWFGISGQRVGQLLREAAEAEAPEPQNKGWVRPWLG